MPQYECCKRETNMKTQAPDPARPGVLVRVCFVCQRRHIEMAVDAGDYAMTLASMG